MRRFSRLLRVWLLFAATALGQSSVSLPLKTTRNLQVANATAAYSLNSSIAEACAENGTVELLGKGVGVTSVVVVVPGGTTSIRVLVVASPAAPPPGLIPSAPAGNVGETGSYDVRYNSNPGQIVNGLEFLQREGDAFKRFQLIGANYLSTSSGSAVQFPLFSYEIGTPRRDLTVGDTTVSNSPLTVDGPLVRGFHLQQGPWVFHAGFASIATFQDIFLATDPEYAAGITRLFKLSPSAYVAANLYYFQNPAPETLISRNGLSGSLVYEYKPSRHFNVLGEIGLSRGVGVAGRVNFDDLKQAFAASFHYLPRDFASLALNNQHGFFADLQYSRAWNERLSGTASFDHANYELTRFRQNTLVSSANLTFQLSRHFRVNGGSVLSSFKSGSPAPFDLQTLTLPAGIDFSSRHFSAGALYQPALDFSGRVANGYGATLGGSFATFHLNAYARHDVQIPTVQALYSAVPGLQDALQRLGIVITDPEQLLQFLGDASLFTTLGLASGLQLRLAPARNDLGLTAGWTIRGSHPQRIDLNVMNSETQLIAGSVRFHSLSVSYTRQLTPSNDLTAFAGLYQTIAARTSTLTPIFEISLRHRFFSTPAFLLPGRHGDIVGHVFQDDTSSGRYSGREPGIARVEVVLDNVRSTRTAPDGSYEFDHVPYGVHHVEAKFQTTKPFFFTTDSPATAGIDSTVNFGVNFIPGRLFGYVVNDAGQGISAVLVELHGPAGSRQTQTAAGGKFTFEGLREGQYSLSTVPDSYPAGYDLLGLAPQSVLVKPSAPSSITFDVRALRSVSGVVKRYNQSELEAVPAPEVNVTIPELSLVTKTDRVGRYVFRGLPAGSFTISVEDSGVPITRPVRLGGGPVVISNLDFIVNRTEPGLH